MKRTYNSTAAQPSRSRRSPLFWLLIVVVAAGILLGLYFLRGNRSTTDIAVNRLPCFASQDVTPFGENVLYYDGRQLSCCTPTGKNLWHFPAGSNASFHCSDTHVVIWHDASLFIVDKNGNSLYNDELSSPIQFARVGESYAVAVVGADTEPDVIIKDLNGNQIDEEVEAFSGLMILDVGFFGEGGQYMWTLSLDLYSTAINSILHTFQVGRTNSGETDLGDKLVYRVLWDNNRLRVFSTQQMYTFDYKAVQDVNSTMLVYGWTLLDVYVPARGDAVMLLSPTNQYDSAAGITDLRVLSGSTDLRYTLPAACVGAAVRDRSVYAFTKTAIYRANINNQSFSGCVLELPDSAELTAYLGTTSNGYSLLACGETVYAVELPR